MAVKAMYVSEQTEINIKVNKHDGRKNLNQLGLKRGER